MRLTWEDGTSVEIYFTAKGENKSQVAIQHTKLPTKSGAQQMKEYWGERLGALSQVLTPSEAGGR
jgi:hypothetical protein